MEDTISIEEREEILTERFTLIRERISEIHEMPEVPEDYLLYFHKEAGYIEQLLRMGAVIHVEGKAAIIEGVPYLKGAPVKADDLRAGAAMLVAGLAARGQTEIVNIHLNDRGYEHVIEKLTALGADIHRVHYPDSAVIGTEVV